MSDLHHLRQKNLTLARKLVRESVSPDLHIINAVNNIEELQRIQNVLSKRLREWYSLYFPELDKKIANHEEYVEHVLKDNKEEMIEEFKVKDSMGGDVARHEVAEMKKLAEAVKKLFDEEKHLAAYLEKAMEKHCINLYTLAGSIIGAKLMRGAGSLRKLAMMRSSTIQLIGAEKALFRHIKTGAKPPKYGHLLQHPLVSKSRQADKGKIARALADKIFVAVRVDYFKGEFIADKLLKEVEVKVNENK